MTEFVRALALGGALGSISMALALLWGRTRGPWGEPGPGSEARAPRVPLTGGHGLGLGLVAGAGVLERLPPAAALPAAAVVVGALFLALGILDDLHRPSPKLRLLVEGAVGLGAAYCIVPALGGTSTLLALFWILLLVNGTNFLDGSDGAAAAASLGSLVAIGLFGGAAAVVGGLCAGILLPFLALNCSIPSKLRLGDGGARMLGGLLAVLTLPEMFSGRWAVGLAVAFLPVSEVVFTVLRRLVHGKPLLVGDRGHLGDRLLERGWTVRQVAGLAFLVALTCGVAGSYFG